LLDENHFKSFKICLLKPLTEDERGNTAMRLIKKAIRAIFSAAGYRLERIAEPLVRFANFDNLSRAYEHRLNELAREKLICEDELRPKLLARLMGTPPSEAYYIVEALARCGHVEGDMCEFGVAQGETSALIANELVRFPGKVLHLFDSFEGLPNPTEKDRLKDDVSGLGSMEAYAGTMSCAQDMVRARLASLRFPPSRCVIHKGFIEKLIHSDRTLPKRVCFAYVDFDLYEPIRIALDFLHTTTSPGAIIMVDDYDYFSTGAKTAVDEFVHGRNADRPIYHLFVPDKRYGCFAVLTRKGP